MTSGVQKLKSAAARIESLYVIRVAALTIRNGSLALGYGDDNRARPCALVGVIHMVDDEALRTHRSEADGARLCLPQTQLARHEPVFADIALETRDRVGVGHGDAMDARNLLK